MNGWMDKEVDEFGRFEINLRQPVVEPRGWWRMKD